VLDKAERQRLLTKGVKVMAKQNSLSQGTAITIRERTKRGQPPGRSFKAVVNCKSIYYPNKTKHKGDGRQTNSKLSAGKVDNYKVRPSAATANKNCAFL
jgi:hypothetical protein